MKEFQSLLPLTSRLAAASMSLNLISVKPKNLGDFQVEIVYPDFNAVHKRFLESQIKHLMEKITQRHCS